jgi:hypothetical protein
MLTFSKCEELTRRRDRKKLGNNTYVERIDADTFGVMYHSTYVVRVHRNGTWTLKTGGWQTVTTKERMNDNSPARIFQRKHVWYLAEGVVFTDGVTIGANGLPVDSVPATPAPVRHTAPAADLFAVV